MISETADEQLSGKIWVTKGLGVRLAVFRHIVALPTTRALGLSAFAIAEANIGFAWLFLLVQSAHRVRYTLLSDALAYTGLIWCAFARAGCIGIT